MTGPAIVPRPPNRLTPPSTTAATALSSSEVAAAGSAEPMRATSRIAARPAIAPEIVYAAIFMRCVRTPTARDPSELPPVASRCVPNRVWNSSTWAPTATSSATITLQRSGPTELVLRSSIVLLITSTGLPSEMTSASPAAMLSEPSVTMKSLIRALAITKPLMKPTAAPTSSAASIASQIDRPSEYSWPSTTPESVSTDPIERSMPAVATANVCPIASTIRTADAASTDSMLSPVRKTSEISPKTTIRTMNAGMTVHSAQKPGSLIRPRSSSIARGSASGRAAAAAPPPAVVVGLLMSAPDQRGERVVVGLDRLREVLLSLGHVVLVDDLHRRLDVGRKLLALRGGEAGLDPQLTDRVRILGHRGRHVAGLDRVQRVL